MFPEVSDPDSVRILKVPAGCEFVSCHCTFWYVGIHEVESDRYCSACGGQYLPLKSYELDFYNAKLEYETPPPEQYPVPRTSAPAPEKGRKPRYGPMKRSR